MSGTAPEEGPGPAGQSPGPELAGARAMLPKSVTDAPGIPRLFDALAAPAYFVGGCVRNALLGAGATDIDLATPLPPDAVSDRLAKAGIKVVPTGVEHGTVTAVLAGAAYEVTTFRADVETDGRRAVVRFTEEMAEDAARRDFTMNALYADRAGGVIDPLGGLPDLRARRVRFIGRPADRIREDYLRILRFFRFSAVYAGRGIEPEGLAACAALADGVGRLAKERIGAEMRKLLAAPDPSAALAAMAQSGVLARVLPTAQTAAFPALVAMERAAGVAPDWLTRLALLEAAGAVTALRLSRAEARSLETLDALVRAADPPALAAEAASPEAARAAALLRAARFGDPLPEDLEAQILRGATAHFPLQAKDLIALGWAPGPALGQALVAARDDWRRSGFVLSKAALIDRLGPPATPVG